MEMEIPHDDTIMLQLQPLIIKAVLSNYDMKEFGYTKSQLLIFSALLLRKELTMSQVAEFIGSSKEQATRAVAPLAEDGLVKRYIDPENRTRIHIRLTKQGKHFIMQYQKGFCNNFNRVLDQTITPEEKLELYKSVQSVVHILNKLS